MTIRRSVWLLPAVAMIICGGWIYQSHRENSLLNHELGSMEQRLLQAEQIAAIQSQQSGSEAQQEARHKQIEWKKLGSIGSSDAQDVLLLHRIQQRLIGLSAEELVAELDAQKQSDLTPRAWEMMRVFIFSELEKKDPKLACERFVDDFAGTDSIIRYRLPKNLGIWHQKDPAGATAWLDRMIQEGKVEGKALEPDNHRRAALEGVLMGNLLTSDIAAAKARISGLPDDLKADIFRQMSGTGQITRENGVETIRLVREQLPEGKAMGVLVSVTTPLIGRDSDFTLIDQCMEGANVTAAEKKAIVSDGLRACYSGSNWNIDALTKARDWAAMHQPEQVDEITGAAMVRAAQEYKTYDQAAKLALAYQEKSGNDAVLVSFLQHAAGDEGFASKARSLIEKIKDPALREMVGKSYPK